MGSRRGVKVELDRERRLRYNLAAMEAIEDRLGVSIMEGEGVDFSSLEDLVWLLWLGLYHAGEEPDVSKLPWWERILIRIGVKDVPELTREDVAEWIDMRDILAVTEALGEAFGGDEIEKVREISEVPTQAQGKKSA